MAIFPGIGRALTSIGTNMRRIEDERAKREQHFADLKDTRDYAETIRDQNAQIRADETQANRDHARQVEANRRTYTEGVTTANRAWTVTEFDRQAGVRADAAEAAGERASDVVDATAVRLQERQELGAEAYDRASQRVPGTLKGPPWKDSNARWGPTPGADVVAMGAANISLAPRVTPDKPPMGLVNVIREEATEWDPLTGNLVGNRYPVADAWNDASVLYNQGRSPVREPSLNVYAPPSFDVMSPVVADPVRDTGAQRMPPRDTGARRIQSAPDSLGGGLTTPPPSGMTIMTDEEFEELRASGEYSDDELSRIWRNSTPGIR